MSLHPLPLTVIGGYLGSGKTTLINRILTEELGLHLMILVNDFGAINIDKKLLVSSENDTLTLTNGCVCCTMGADLFMAIDKVLSREPRPDHLIIEASGIANPASIANVAKAEPDLRYCGIITVVDGNHFVELSDDTLIGAQIRSQVTCSDVIVISKSETIDTTLTSRIASLTSCPIISFSEISVLKILLTDDKEKLSDLETIVPHPEYFAWTHQDKQTYSTQTIIKKLKTRPSGIFRLKGIFQDPQENNWTIQVVGKDSNINRINLSQTNEPYLTSIVAIGLKELVSEKQIEDWWNDMSTV